VETVGAVRARAARDVVKRIRLGRAIDAGTRLRSGHWVRHGRRNCGIRFSEAPFGDQAREGPDAKFQALILASHEFMVRLGSMHIFCRSLLSA